MPLKILQKNYKLPVAGTPHEIQEGLSDTKYGFHGIYSIALCLVCTPQIQVHFLFRPAGLNVFQKRHVFQKPIDLESTPGAKVSEGNNLMRIERRKIHYETGIDNGFSVDAVASLPYNDRRIKRGGTWPYDDRRGKQTVRTFGGYASLL